MALPVVIVTGPTASGKTELAERIARDLQGEVISADSRTLYRELRIGTGRYTHSDDIPYHLVGVVDIGTTYSVYRFLNDSRAAIRDIRSRGKIPVVCGGTMLYVERLIKGLDPAPPPDRGLRKRLYTILEEEGTEGLFDLLSTIDPGSALRVDRRNPRRLVRTLEITIGRSNLKEAVPSLEGPLLSFFLDVEGDELLGNISARTEKMIDLGWLDEVKALIFADHSAEEAGLDSIGYQEIFSVARGEMKPEDAADLIKVKTWGMARSQIKWSKRIPSDRVNISRSGSGRIFADIEEAIEA